LGLGIQQPTGKALVGSCDQWSREHWRQRQHHECHTEAGKELTVKIFADGADMEGILRLAGDPLISGFTTNPTLMHQSGISEYEGFARKILDHVVDRPVSFEVFSDDFAEMGRQARRIASWGPNVIVKIPITNTEGESSADLVEDLSRDGLRLNVTALMTVGQVETMAHALEPSPGSIVSVFAGRIADTGRDPVPIMIECLKALQGVPQVELLWASPREILNVYQADEIGCHIITVTHDLLAKLSLRDKDLAEYSLETVQMFHRDAAKAGYLL
jgi:transaldolase